MFTVFFASRVLKKAQPQKQIAEQDISRYIITDWNKNWATEEKKNAVADAIRNLVVLGWIKLQFSDTIAESA